jgi:hypothetical protein
VLESTACRAMGQGQHRRRMQALQGNHEVIVLQEEHYDINPEHLCALQ